MTKVCRKCKIPKDLEKEFHRNRQRPDGRQDRCKLCLNGKAKEDRKRWKEEGIRIVDQILKKYKDVPCMDCDGVFEWCAMDFDHRPGETKVLSIGGLGCHKATPEHLTRVEKEIAKCDLICSNCHRIRTHVTRQKDE